MHRFDEDWDSSKTPVTIGILDGEEVEATWSSTGDVKLEGRRDERWILLNSGRGTHRVRGKYHGFSELRLRGSGQVEFGFRFRRIVRQDGEPLNSDNPPAPPLPGSDNFLLQVRRIMRQELKRKIGPYLEPEELPFGDRYVIDEDDERFEEELAAEAAAVPPSSPAKPDSSSGNGAANAPTPAASAPEARPEGSENTPVKHAAE